MNETNHNSEFSVPVDFNDHDSVSEDDYNELKLPYVKGACPRRESIENERLNGMNIQFETLMPNI